MNWWKEVFLVGIGGFAGSVARFLAGEAVTRAGILPGLPAATLLVNVVGCFAIGVLGGSEALWSTDRRLLLQVGLLGGFTTFSAFGLETFSLLRDGMVGRALANILLHVVLGIGAAAAGWALLRTS